MDDKSQRNPCYISIFRKIELYWGVQKNWTVLGGGGKKIELYGGVRKIELSGGAEKLNCTGRGVKKNWTILWGGSEKFISFRNFNRMWKDN